jgi:peptidoglycan hydrolase CwlO-like protein
VNRFFIVLGSVLLVLIASYYTINRVSAIKSNNPNFVTYDKFESVLQNSLNVVWSSIEDINNNLTQINKKLDNMDARLSKIEANQ